MTPPEQMTLECLPPPDADAPLAHYREHTAAHWRRHDPETYGQCVELIRLGFVNQSELAAQFQRSRNTIKALMMEEFTAAELHQIISRSAAIGTALALDKAMELLDKTSAAKDLGGVAMALTALHNVKQLASGGPTEIKRVEHRLSWEDFQKSRRLAPPPPVVDAEVEMADGQHQATASERLP